MQETEYKWKIILVDSQGDNFVLSESTEYFSSLLVLWEDLLLKVFFDTTPSLYSKYYYVNGHRREGRAQLFVHIWRVGARIFKLNGKLRLPNKGETNRSAFLHELGVNKHIVKRLKRMRDWYVETYTPIYYRGIITR